MLPAQLDPWSTLLVFGVIAALTAGVIGLMQHSRRL